MRTKKYGTELFVWYPVSKNVDEEKYVKPLWMPHGVKTLKGLVHLSTGWPLDRSWTPTFFFSGLRNIKMNALTGAPLSEDFKHKKLIPIFFSHGLTCHP